MATSSIKQAVYLNAAARYSTLVLRLLFNAALARILVPEDFGVVAVAMVFTTFFSLLSDMGLGAGIIQNKELSREDIGSIFAFSLRLGLVLMGAFVLLSFPMAYFYGNQALVPVGMLLSFQLFFTTLNIVPNALLLKRKEFKKVALRTLCACLVSGTVGIGLALLGLKYYALVGQAILDAAFLFGWNYLSTRPPMARRPRRESLDKIRSYSGYLFGFSLINFHFASEFTLEERGNEEHTELVRDRYYSNLASTITTELEFRIEVGRLALGAYGGFRFVRYNDLYTESFNIHYGEDQTDNPGDVWYLGARATWYFLSKWDKKQADKL
jgi:hypothetical protein